MQILAEKVNCDKADHGYIELYKQLIPKDLQCILEIGLLRGESARLWRGWLRNWEHIDIIDITSEYIAPELLADLNECGVRTFFEDVKTLDTDRLAYEYEVIIDDGSHCNADQIEAFKRLWPKVAPGGWYVIEDLHTHGGYAYARRNGAETWNSTTHPMIMDWLLQQWHVLNQHGECEYGCDGPVIHQMRCYRSIVAFQKP